MLGARLSEVWGHCWKMLGGMWGHQLMLGSASLLVRLDILEKQSIFSGLCRKRAAAWVRDSVWMLIHSSLFRGRFLFKNSLNHFFKQGKSWKGHFILIFGTFHPIYIYGGWKSSQNCLWNFAKLFLARI